MPEGRPQLYKIRRLVKREDGLGERYEWYDGGSKWLDLEMDGFAYTNMSIAVKACEQFKVKNKNPRVLYHTVVPA